MATPSQQSAQSAKKRVADFVEQMEDFKVIGVHVHRCDIRKTEYYFRRPAISVHLIDGKKGHYVEKKTDGDSGGSTHVEPATSKYHDVIEKRFGSF